MAPCVVSFGHDIEEERFNIVVQSLVVQEEFGQQTQVLTINLGEVHHYKLKYKTFKYICKRLQELTAY